MEPSLTEPVFRVARNPDPASRLPYLLWLPVTGESPVILVSAVDWPAAKDAFCHQIESWPDGAELLAEVPVDSCARVGRAVRLVLGRRQRRRSLFVWTMKQGRTLVFWRTPKTMTGARPGLKVPAARGLERPLRIAVDERERYAWQFPGQRARLDRRALPVGDYGVFDGDRLVAAVERKSPANLASDAVSGQLGFALSDLERLPHACLVVEGRLSDVLKAAAGHVKHDWLMSVMAALQVAHPRVPWVYAESRALAQDYAYRWLAAAQGRRRGTAGATPGRAATEAPGTQLPLLDPTGAYKVRDAVARHEEAMRLAVAGRAWTSGEYARHFDVSQTTAWKDLTDLVARGRLAAEGRRRSRRYVAPAADGA